MRSVAAPILWSFVIGFVSAILGAHLGDITAGQANAAQEQPLGSATYLAKGMCQSWEEKNVAQNCEVNTWRSRIEVKLDTTAPEALKSCREVRDVVARKTDAFEDRGWRLRIEKPNGLLLAECGLR
jgi:hypothetical protein